MMYFKGCPKCDGDLYAGEDIHGQYVSCIQCGYLRDETPVDSMESPGEDTHLLTGKTYVIDVSIPAKKRRENVTRVARALAQG